MTHVDCLLALLIDRSKLADKPHLAAGSGGINAPYFPSLLWLGN